MLRLLEKYHRQHPVRWPIIERHSRLVADKAIAIARSVARRQPVDLAFIEEAALLHDIGIHLTNAPEIGCHGKHPYLLHGLLGREILIDEGLPRHALVCERHIGVGLSRDDIIAQGLPLPVRDMLPLSIEEQIITYADLFFSKSPPGEQTERPFNLVRQRLARHGDVKAAILDRWHAAFST